MRENGLSARMRPGGGGGPYRTDHLSEQAYDVE